MLQRELKTAMYTLPSPVPCQRQSAVNYPAQDDPGLAVHDSHLRRVVEQMPGIVWTTDLELNLTFSLGNGLGRLNPVIHPYDGMPLSEFFGDESVHSPVLDAHYNALGGYAQSFELDVHGATFWGTVEPLFNSDWNLIGTVGNAVEITSLRDVEAERIRQLTRMHEADRRQALLNLAGGITEHYRRLFHAMSAYAAIIGMGLPSDHPSQRWLSSIEKAAECANDLAEQMVCPGPSLRHNEAVHVTALIRDHLESFQALLPKKVSFQVDLEEQNVSVLADPEEIRRLLINLLYNASEFVGSEEGTISLRTQTTKGPPWPVFDRDADNDLPEGDYLWLQVSDTGRGLDDDAKARIFEPFAGYSGRGIGMGPALSLVSSMHGTMSLSSKPGLGTTCHVFLPIMPHETAQMQAPECFF